MKNFKDPKRQKGLALVVVIWISIAMTLLVTSFVKIVKNSISTAGTEYSLLAHYTSLDGALELTMFRLIDKKTELLWLHREKVQKTKLNGKEINIKITDPAGLIDLNYSDRNILFSFISRIIGNRSKANTITEQILSRRKVNNNSTKSNSQFPFRHYEELLQLQEMNAEYFGKLKRFITVYSGRKKINPATAPREVLLAVPGVTRPSIDLLVKRRKDNPLDKKIYADVITRSDGILSIAKRDVHIIYISAPWGKSGRLVGRRYVVAIGLDKEKPYRLLSWSNYSGTGEQGV